MTTRPGDVVDGRYRIDAELGRGGMGVVYRGTQLSLDRPVAIKRLLHTGDAAAVARLQREALSTGRLAHPGIVQVLDAGLDHGEPYLVMELLDGVPLDAHLAQRGHLPLDEALGLAAQLADALGAAHAAGILHRDVKPANAMLGRDGRVRLLDFGLARLGQGEASRLTQFGAFVGTPAYLSPEVSRGGEPDARTDVYALGITLYELLTGRVPFEGESLIATVLAHLTEPLVPPSRHVPSIPPSVDALLATLLAREPEGRPFDGHDARDRIDALRLPVRRPTSSGAHARETVPTPHDLDAVILAALAGD